MTSAINKIFIILALSMGLFVLVKINYVHAQTVSPIRNVLTPGFFTPTRGGPTASPKPAIDPTIKAMTPTVMPLVKNKPNGIDLSVFLIISFVYIMTVHLALGIRDQAELLFMVVYFILGGVLGWWFSSYEAGLILGIVLSLLFI